ncbi:type IV pilus assembly PilZ [Desulfarculus baarsii DSM 2075]|uniref:Type IV pilus assembly PilZ n=1 Tax=Desulfarculus baarsii (strain ATCC 33931 / DSM 2075 / LMG 7858 / VKM B-1802 / 2st14) TaxID=644282 RepID=E1QIW7_DESB2|nr:PilZ domain-containing protein [Desulfarculus baarsii]ADK85510.1 type IV pilus assembly PilZ [Desulfarculus baarsii DSM 2075]
MISVMEMEEPDPRRMSARRQVSLQATVEYLCPDGGWFPVRAWVTEVSAQGMRLRVPREATISQRDELHIFIHKHGIEATGKVSHVLEPADSHVATALGVKLTEISSQHYELWRRLVEA